MLYLRVKIGDSRWCFSRSTQSIIDKSDTWEYAGTQVIASIPASIEQIQVCTDSLPASLWTVAVNNRAVDTPPTRPLKNEAMVDKWRIAVGVACEDATVSTLAGGLEYRHATNGSGQRGIAVCEKK